MVFRILEIISSVANNIVVYDHWGLHQVRMSQSAGVFSTYPSIYPSQLFTVILDRLSVVPGRTFPAYLTVKIASVLDHDSFSPPFL